MAIQKGRVALRDVAENILNAVEEGQYAKPEEDDLIAAFRTLDKENLGSVTVEQLRHILLTAGMCSCWFSL